MVFETDDTQRFFEKMEIFRDRTGMYVDDGNYDNVCSFICGLDFCSNGEPLKGFEVWLRREFKLESPFYWGRLIEYIFNQNDIENTEENKIKFLFDLVFKFISEKNS